MAPLGSGGMGEVYRSRDTRLGREVALKVLPAGLSSDKERLVRFAQEARSASALSHPNIVTIYEVGQAGSLPFIAMELIDGQTLRALLDQGALPLKKALQIGFQMADGLAKAHSAGIVHRDLKPENVMITKDGYAKLLDFGLAKLVGTAPGSSPGEPSMTATGFVMGTAGYMSPEQASGRPVDARSDQFALGLILYEMVTGRRAFSRSTAVQTLSAIIQEEPDPIEKFNPRIPLPFRWVVERCLAKDPEDRYASTRDLARDLQNQREFAVAGNEPSQMAPAVPASELASTARFSQEDVPALGARPAPTGARRALSVGLSALGGFLMLALGAGAGYWLRGSIAEPPAPRWNGDLLLAGTIRVFSPRISPDSQTLAFLTVVAGVSQVAILKPGSGDWIVLTHQKSLGSVDRMDWSNDGGRLYFDRVTESSRGIYSIPVLGGEERLVLEDAQDPEVLPDGSFLVVRIDPDRNFRVHRFWPDSGKLQAVGPPIVRESAGLGLRAFSGGREAVFFGKLAAPGGGGVRCAYILDLASGRASRFAPEVPISPPVTLSADRKNVLADVVVGDLHRIVSIPKSGVEPRTLMTVPSKPWYLNEAGDGTLYVEFLDNPVELLRFPQTGGTPDRLASVGRNFFMHPVQLPDGRVLLPSLSSGRRRLLIASPGEPLHPFFDSSEQAAPPVAAVGEKLLAFVGGGTSAKSPPVLTLATSSDGRITKRLEATRGVTCAGLSASPDGRTLYYADGGSIWGVLVEGGAPRKLHPGNGVAASPDGLELVVQMNEKEGVRLVRVPISGGPDQPIPVSSDLRLSTTPIAGSAVGRDGRVVVSVSARDGLSAGPAILELSSGKLERVPVSFEGDVIPSTWGINGSLLGMGVATKSDLWRFRPADAEPRKN